MRSTRYSVESKGGNQIDRSEDMAHTESKKGLNALPEVLTYLKNNGNLMATWQRAKNRGVANVA